MTTVVKYIIGLSLLALGMLSCNSEPSLQKYLVEKQDDDKFMKVDLATSLLQSEEANFTQEEKDVLNSVKKINVVAYPLKGNTAEYDVERKKLQTILASEKYQTLLKMGSNKSGATLKFTGEEDAIDELIVFATDSEKGFAVFRLIGDDMEPDSLVKLMSSIDRGDVDVSQLKSIGNMFDMELE
ncbi:DUF4252 domain-containing protein [Marinirhabdus gelatinilytica]|uniref:Uncharacterized protein DUF4252 n=1 Tax=Marinirhabdus gelatinilytica TaxID=1703343 RepID=A0A370QFQ7_9FLAO|nr:DUF4252 domain-containing protein [Marinirhabdus gelatinilytica]RDK87192.1 uncharacterized protein DUF4252 [Marinirhabdus gelatinilytica]